MVESKDHPTSLRPDLRTYPDLASVSKALAQKIAAEIVTTEVKRDRFDLALAGGNTPRTLYTLLAKDFYDRIPWNQVHLFWGDERYVPPDDPRSNYHLVRESLLDHISIPETNIHQMPTDFENPNDAAESYEAVLRRHFPFPWPSFNLVLLGLGVEGHTASLFPGSAILEEKKRWVASTLSPTDRLRRLTLTLPAIAHAEQIYFLVVGNVKANAMQQILTTGSSAPAARLIAERPDSVFWTDEAAATLVIRGRMPSSE
jgi:6-phosphogluconolactonase